jgi:hypothetical protein
VILRVHPAGKLDKARRERQAEALVSHLAVLPASLNPPFSFPENAPRLGFSPDKR